MANTTKVYKLSDSAYLVVDSAGQQFVVSDKIVTKPSTPLSTINLEEKLFQELFLDTWIGNAKDALAEQVATQNELNGLLAVVKLKTEIFE